VLQSACQGLGGGGLGLAHLNENLKSGWGQGIAFEGSGHISRQVTKARWLTCVSSIVL
jgi:hypothetical protein